MQPWPALITDSPGDLEVHMQRGADFHRLAHQHTLELDPQILASTIHDETLADWWQTYLAHPPPDLPATSRYAEVVVAAPLGRYSLLAKFDLLAVEPGERLVIVDWKTVLKPPTRTILAGRLQTRTYRYLCAETGATFNNGQRPRPEQIEMVYWFAADNGATQCFPYDADQHGTNRDYLTSLIAEITSRQESIWPLTTEERLCRLCNYRSLCERGVKAGFLEELDDTPESIDPEIDLELIAEIAF
jgi:hypothetical protein